MSRATAVTVAPALRKRVRIWAGTWAGACASGYCRPRRARQSGPRR
jgi:hypothetical protein